MAYKMSKAARNLVNNGYSFAQLFHGGKLLIYAGSAPANADDAPSGALLATLTDSSGAHTAEVKATGTVTVTGTTGSITDVTVNSISILGTTVPFNSTVNQTASDLAAAINKTNKSVKYRATVSGATVTISAPPGAGTQVNTHVVAVTGTLTTTTGNMAGGVNSANGLKFGDSAAGVLAKDSAQTWSGVAGNTGTAGYYRLVPAQADSGAADATETYPRLQGDIAVSGAALNLGSTSIVNGATVSVNTYTLTEPSGS
jgi:hypothetical protein